MEADDAVGEQPDAVEKWIPARDQLIGAPLRPTGFTIWANSVAPMAQLGAQQGRADILGHLALKLDALAFGFV